MKNKTLIILTIISVHLVSAQDSPIYKLTLEEVITLANDSSLNAFIAQNNYLASYWTYKNHKAGKLPNLDLNSTPANYSRSVNQEYSFTDSTYYYVNQQTFNSYFNLSLSQNITKTGAKIYIDSDISRLENLSGNSSSQYSSTLIRVGLEQQLFAHNSFKWDDKTEPIKFEQAKREYIEASETTAITAITYFFNQVKAQVDVEIAIENHQNAIQLYQMSKKRFAIASITQEDLLTLELDMINAKNDLKAAERDLKKARLKLNSFLRVDKNTRLEPIVPEMLPLQQINHLEALSQAKLNNPFYLDNQYQLLSAAENVNKAKAESRFSAQLNASYGLNQTGSELAAAYTRPTDQQIASLTLSIPIVDWGLAKGQHKLAQRQQEALRLTIEQSEIDFEQNLLAKIEEFNYQQELVKSLAKADTIARKAFELSKKRFTNGKADIIKLNATKQSRSSAKRNYILSLENYWSLYYSIRKQTQYDYINNKRLTQDFDELIGVMQKKH